MLQTQNQLDPLIFSSAPIGMAVINTASGRIVQANDAYCRLLGYSREHVEGRTWMHFTHPEDIAQDLLCIRRMHQEGLAKIERTKRYIKPDCTIVHARIHITQLNQYHAPIHLVMVMDTSETYRYRQQMKERFGMLKNVREAIYHSLAVVAQFRDRETGEHLNRTNEYVRLLFNHLPFSHPFSRHGIEEIARASRLHDIGKVAIPDNILLKAGPLTQEERQLMQTHTTTGALAIRETMQYMPSDAVLTYAHDIALYHHEWWDGSGYPEGLAGNGIPLVARIMAIADVYDALRSERVYKQAMNHARALEVMTAEKGSHLDPQLLDAFIAESPQVQRIHDNQG